MSSNTLAFSRHSILLSQSHRFRAYDAGDIPDNVGVPPVAPSGNVEEVCRDSNSVDVQIVDDLQPYEIARAVDSDDDRPFGELTESDIELIRRYCPGRDPSVHEFSDLRHSHGAYAEGRDDELLDAPEAGSSMTIEKGMVFEDLSALKRWL